MSHEPTICPKCGHSHLTETGYADKHYLGHGAYLIWEGLQHGSTLKLLHGVTKIASRLIDPKGFTCKTCSHSWTV